MLADLFHEKRLELDTLLTMIGERGTPAFRYNCHRLYGTVDHALRQLAEGLLDEVTPLPAWRGARVDARGFCDFAARELAYYAAKHSGIRSKIQIRRDVMGLLVSEGNLLIGESLQLRPDRVEPLIHHEVGTHVVTYVNGSAQRLQQLALGLADYDELQEGLAVLAEYLLGGLDRPRMRLLGARVVAAHSVEQGADFVQTFRLLRQRYGYNAEGAWSIAIRVHASGGFTRDLIYLRGLINLLELLKQGAELRTLYVGKIAQKHLPVIEELRHRKVLREPPLLPRFLDLAGARARLDHIRRGISLTDMICRPAE